MIGRCVPLPKSYAEAMATQGVYGGIFARSALGQARRDSPSSRRRRRGWLVFKILMVFVLALVVALTTFVKGLLAAPFDLKVIPPAPKSILLLAADGTQFGLIRPAERREIISPQDIPEVMRQAIISAEDARFLDHKGVDALATLRAAYYDVTEGERKGASTITQQYVKNAYVGNERTLMRKLREAALAVRLEERKTKEEILTDYLNVLFLGNSTYGVQAASKYYFGVDVKNIDRETAAPDAFASESIALARASMLAGIAPAPSLWNPVSDFRAARERQKYTLNQMVLNGYISTAKASAAFQREEVVRPLRDLGPEPPSTAPEYADLVKAQLKDSYKDDLDTFDRGGLRVQTALDTDLQEAVTRAAREVLPDPSDPQAAVVAIDITNGNVKAMTTLRRVPAKVGPPPRAAITDYERGGFNLATNANRSTGSTIKPFTLAAALQKGLTLDTTRPAPGCDTIKDPTAPGGVYRYCNAAGESSSSRGSMTLRSALQRSVNTVYTPLAIEVGQAEVKQLMLDSGVVANEDAFGTTQKSFGLGTTALVTPLSMANAYGTLVNGGAVMTPRFVLETRDVDGSVLKKEPERPAPARRAMPINIANQVAEAMSGVTEDAGTAPRARQPFPVYGKTGTTNGSTDAWFIGCARAPQNLCIATWMGYDDQTCTGIVGRACGEMKDIQGVPQVYGGTLPAMIFARTFEILAEIQAAKQLAAAGLPPPASPVPSLTPSAAAVAPSPAPTAAARRSASPSPQFTVPTPLAPLTQTQAPRFEPSPFVPSPIPQSPSPSPSRRPLLGAPAAAPP